MSLFALAFEWSTPAPGGVFNITLRSNPGGGFAIALVQPPAFDIVLRDNGAASFAIAFAATGGTAFNLSVSDTLGLSDTQSIGGTIAVSVSDTLGISSGAARDFTPFVPIILGTIEVGSGPFGIGYDGTDVWVANYGSSTLSKISTTTRAVIATVDLPPASGPTDFAFDSEHGWVPLALARAIARINIARNTVTAIEALPSYPRSAMFDGTDLWVPINTNGASGTLPVTVFNPTPGGGTSNEVALAVTGIDISPLPN